MVGLQVTQHLIGNMNCLQLEAASVLDVSRLGQHLKHRGPQPPACRFVPLRHFGVTLPAAVEIIGKQIVRQRRTKQTVLFTDDDLQEVAEQRAVLHGGGEDCMGSDRAFAVTDQSPQVRPHHFQSTTNQLGETAGRGGVTGLKDVLRHDGVLPAFGIDVAQQQVGNEPALWQLQCSCGDVGLVTHFRHFDHPHRPPVTLGPMRLLFQEYRL